LLPQAHDDVDGVDDLIEFERHRRIADHELPLLDARYDGASERFEDERAGGLRVLAGARFQQFLLAAQKDVKRIVAVEKSLVALLR